MGGKVLGIAASAAAIGAAYYFLGPKGKKHQKEAKKWMEDAKVDVVAEIRKAKKITQVVYENIVDSVLEKYEDLADEREEVAKFAEALKDDWDNVVEASKKEISKAKRKGNK